MDFAVVICGPNNHFPFKLFTTLENHVEIPKIINLKSKGGCPCTVPANMEKGFTQGECVYPYREGVRGH